MSSYIIPILLVVVVASGLLKKIDVFTCFLDGAKMGLKSGIDIIPTLVAIMTVIAMFKISGGLDVLSNFLAPVFEFIGIPKEVIPLGLIRPISGSGALCLYEDIISTNHPDSFIGRCASIMMGASETTFYTVAVYYGAVNVKNIRFTLIPCLLADLTVFILSCAIINFFDFFDFYYWFFLFKVIQ